MDERGCPTDSDNDGVPDARTSARTRRQDAVAEKGCPMEEPSLTHGLPRHPVLLHEQRAINVDGKNWLQFGDVQTGNADELEQIGDYRGLRVRPPGRAPPLREVFLPLCDGEGRYQPFRLESEVRGTLARSGALEDGRIDRPGRSASAAAKGPARVGPFR